MKCRGTSSGSFYSCWLSVHSSGVSAPGPSWFWWNGFWGQKADLLTAFPACFAEKIVPGSGGGSVQHCLHSEHDIINNNNRLTIIVRSHCAVQSCGVSMYHDDPSDPHVERLYPSSMHTPDERKRVFILLFSWLFFFSFSKEARSAFLAVYFSLPKTFFFKRKQKRKRV